MKKLSSLKKLEAQSSEHAQDTNAESIINEYSGKSESELMNELLNTTAKLKAEGKFDTAALQQGMQAILPMLNDEQKQKLFRIVGQL